MKNLGTMRVYFWGSRSYYNRVVWKNEKDNTYWVKWYGNMIQAENVYGYEISDGWKTVESY